VISLGGLILEVMKRFLTHTEFILDFCLLIFLLLISIGLLFVAFDVVRKDV